MNAHDGKVNVIEKFVVEFHRHAGAEENHDLLLPVLLEESEKQQESLFGRANNVALLQTVHGGHFFCVVDAYVKWLFFQGQFSKCLSFSS